MCRSLEGVGSGFKLVDDLLELEHRDRVLTVVKYLGYQPSISLISLVLEAADLTPVL